MSGDQTFCDCCGEDGVLVKHLLCARCLPFFDQGTIWKSGIGWVTASESMAEMLGINVEQRVDGGGVKPLAEPSAQQTEQGMGIKQYPDSLHVDPRGRKWFRWVPGPLRRQAAVDRLVQTLHDLDRKFPEAHIPVWQVYDAYESGCAVELQAGSLNGFGHWLSAFDLERKQAMVDGHNVKCLVKESLQAFLDAYPEVPVEPRPLVNLVECTRCGVEYEAVPGFDICPTCQGLVNAEAEAKERAAAQDRAEPLRVEVEEQCSCCGKVAPEGELCEVAPEGELCAGCMELWQRGAITLMDDGEEYGTTDQVLARNLGISLIRAVKDRQKDRQQELSRLTRVEPVDLVPVVRLEEEAVLAELRVMLGETDRDLYERIKAQARDNYRDVGGEVLVLLRKALDMPRAGQTTETF